MFNQPTTLIVVYKDEMLVNFFKKLVETKTGNNLNINVVSWSEKVWLSQKKAGNINSKILFLGNVKGTEKLLPVVDLKLDKYGIKYGWAGNQAVISVEDKKLKEHETYLNFADELNKMPIPQSYKIIIEEETIKETEMKNPAPDAVLSEEEQTDDDNKLKEILKVKDAVVEKFDLLGNMANKTKNDIVNKSQELFRDRNQLKSQMMLYGIVQFYSDSLETFINL